MVLRIRTKINIKRPCLIHILKQLHQQVVGVEYDRTILSKKSFGILYFSLLLPLPKKKDRWEKAGLQLPTVHSCFEG